MRVITIGPGALKWQCRLMARQICDERPDGFDAAVGVLTGGACVADNILYFFPEGYFGTRENVRMRRGGSYVKGLGLVEALLGKVPISLLNYARIAESMMLQVKHAIVAKPRPVPSLPQSLNELLASKERPKVLLIDDAIDSGATLQAVMEAMKQVNPRVEITVAVITVTTSKPKVKADYAVYTDSTLVRFPWSIDYKQMEE